MKIVILITLLCSFLFAYEKQIDDRQAFDTLLIKLGITSLTKDFENEKENILRNTNDIEELKQQVKFLLQENLKLKLNVSDTNLSFENEQLKQEIIKLKNNIQSPKQNLNTTTSNEKQYIKTKMHSLDGLVLNSPESNGKVVRIIPKDEVIYIESCDRFGWCKILNKNEYIAQYKLYFFKE